MPNGLFFPACRGYSFPSQTKVPLMPAGSSTKASRSDASPFLIATVITYSALVRYWLTQYNV